MEKKPKSKLSGNIITTTCSYDCGGRCLLQVYIKDNKILRIGTSGYGGLHIKACPRGLAQKEIALDSSRLTKPLKRIGKKGDGKFEPISWNESIKVIADRIKQVIKKYGTESIYFVTGSGSMSTLHDSSVAAIRFFSMLGKCTTAFGGASFEGALQSSLATFGTSFTACTRDNFKHSQLIILWGWNPKVTRFGPDTFNCLLQAKKTGARVICVDPRENQSCQALAEEWIPIKPGTDTAMLIAMAYVMINEGLYDRDFIHKYTFGFDRFCKYVTGGEDGQVKTPQWAQNICGVPENTILKIAREYASVRPAALVAGWAPGRSAYGEQFHRAASTLAAMTGNIGIKGGYVSGGNDLLNLGLIKDKIPIPKIEHNQIHFTDLYEALLYGTAKGYPSDCKLLYITGCNLLNQYMHVNKGTEALMNQDFTVVQDLFLTPTARYADIVLPISHFFEHEDIGQPWTGGPYTIFMNKILDPPQGVKSDLQVFSEISAQLDIKKYNYKLDKEWLETFLKSKPDFPHLETLKKTSVYHFKLEQPIVAFKKQIEDIEKNPFPTPSGKIEIYSHMFARINNPLIPPIPKYIAPWEGPQDELVKDYPIQLISPHSRARVNSQFHNIEKLQKYKDDDLWMNPDDAHDREIRNGEMVIVFNRRGQICVRAKVTNRVMRGVASIDQGQWYAPDKDGLDFGGCINVLTLDKKSPAGAFPFNTCLVQIKKYKT